MKRLALTAAAAVLLSLMLHAAGWAARNILWIGLVLLALGWAALMLHHRRHLAAVRELETVAAGRFRRVHPFQHWPKECRDCGTTVYTHRAIAAHGNPGACSSPAAGPAEPEAAPARYSATVLDGTGDGAVDTLSGLDGGGQAAELPGAEHRAATWGRIDKLIEGTTQR